MISEKRKKAILTLFEEDGSNTERMLEAFRAVVELLKSNTEASQKNFDGIEDAIESLHDRVVELNDIIDKREYRTELAAIKRELTQMITAVELQVPEKGEKGEPGEQGSPDTPEEVRNKLESLKGDERIDVSAIKGLDKGRFATVAQFKRAIDILDQRTQFLINKTQSSGGGSSYTNADAQAATGWTKSSTNVILSTITDSVAVGTATPTANHRLTVVSPTNNADEGIIVYANNLTQNVKFGWNQFTSTAAYTISSGGALTLKTTSASNITFSPNNSAAMTVDSGGSVGIGTTSPTAGKLVVSGGMIRVEQNTTASGPLSYISLADVGGVTDWRIGLGNESISNFYIGGSGLSTQYFWRANWNDTGTPANTFRSASGAAGQVVMAINGATSQSANYLQITASGGSAGGIFAVNSSGNVGIGSATPTTAKLEVVSAAASNLIGALITQSDTTNNKNALKIISAVDPTSSNDTREALWVESTNAGQWGSIQQMYQNSASPAGGDVIGQIGFYGNSSTGVKRLFAGIAVDAEVVTNGAETAEIRFFNMLAGTSSLRLSIGNTINGIAVGSTSATGIIQSGGSTNLTIQTGNATTGTLTLANGANGHLTWAPNGTGKFITSTIVGSTSASGTLTVLSTTNATKGKVIFGAAGTTAYDEVNGRWGIGTASPSNTLHVVGPASGGVGVSYIGQFDHSAQYGGIVINSSSDKQVNLYLFKGGASKFQIGVDYAGNGTNDFYIYDNTRSAAFFYGASNGDFRIGGDTFNNSGTIANFIESTKNVGIGGITAPLSRLDTNASIGWGYRAITGARTLDVTDCIVNCTANTFTVTLPAASTATRRIYVIKNTGAGTITVDGDGSETIDGSATATVNAGTSLMIACTGTAWIII